MSLGIKLSDNIWYQVMSHAGEHKVILFLLAEFLGLYLPCSRTKLANFVPKNWLHSS